MPRTGPSLPSGWRSVVLITWALAFACMLAVAVSSRTIGRPVWWLGPTTNPTPAVALLVPVLIVSTPIAAAIRAWRSTALVSVACSVLLALSALPDAPDRLAVAVATWTVATATLLANIGVLVGLRQYR